MFSMILWCEYEEKESKYLGAICDIILENEMSLSAV